MQTVDGPADLIRDPAIGDVALEDRDYFTDYTVLADPYSFFAARRKFGPVQYLKDRDIVMITGFDEAREVLGDADRFSAITGSLGPTVALPFEPQGDDISEQIEANREYIPLSNMPTSLDGAAHHEARSLLNKLFVPARLKANKEYMARLASTMVSEIVSRGECDMINEVSTPFVTFVIADLMGVPPEDRDKFLAVIRATPTNFNLNDEGNTRAGKGGYHQMANYFRDYVSDRRANPRDDILTQIASATYPNGKMPEVHEIVTILLVLFGAGQDTSARLLGNSTRYLAENRDMQVLLRNDPNLIPAFVEEMMRVEGTTKMTSRLARKTTVVGGVEIRAGQRIAVAIAAANRDPRRFDKPDEFRLDRPKAMDHVGFGRGPHVCIGAPLARAEVIIFLGTLLLKTSVIRLSEARHGLKGALKLKYEPNFGLRSLAELFVEFEPA